MVLCLSWHFGTAHLWFTCDTQDNRKHNAVFFVFPISRLVQPSVHQLHSAASHLLLPAADLLPCHSHGHAVLGVLLD